MTESADYCEELVRAADKDRFLATLFAPAQTRSDLFALYAFDLETAAVPQRVRDPVAGEIRYQWWHDGLSGASESAGHPVVSALLSALSRRGVPVSLALTVVDARRRALYADNESEAEFELRTSQTEGGIYEMAARILAHEPPETVRLASHHAGVATAAAQTAALAWNPAALVRQHLDAVRALIATVPQDALPAFLPLALVARGRGRLPQWRKQWVLWRASKNLARWI